MKSKPHNVDYNLIAKRYDWFLSLYFQFEETSPRTVVANLIEERDQNLLEVCCGTCQTSIKIAQENKFVNITAIDRSKEMLNIAKNNIDNLKLSNIDLKVMDATKLDIDNDKFDVAVLSLVLHEIDEQLQEKMLSEIHRVLKSNGKLIVVEWNQPKTFWKSLKFLIIKLSEPKPFKKLMKENIYNYFDNKNFYVDNIVYADYTKVITVKKKNEL